MCVEDLAETISLHCITSLPIMQGKVTYSPGLKWSEKLLRRFMFKGAFEEPAVYRLRGKARKLFFFFFKGTFQRLLSNASTSFPASTFSLPLTILGTDNCCIYKSKYIMKPLYKLIQSPVQMLFKSIKMKTKFFWRK